MVTCPNTVTLYGIKNCDTIKKTRLWLEAHTIPFYFHDYRVDGLSPELLASFTAHLGWEALLNTRSATWRQLDDSLRLSIHHDDAAADLMLAYPTLIKRPLLVQGKRMIVGFTPQRYDTFFAKVNAL